MRRILSSAVLLLSACAPAAPPARIAGLDPPASPGAMTPHLVAAGDGVLLSWFEPEGEKGQGVVKFARLERDGPAWRWGAARRIVDGRSFFANWADFPSIQQGRDGSLLVHWLEKTGVGDYTYGVQLARSDDGGASWHGLGMAHDDGVPAEHGFVSIVPEGEGFRAFWLDGRETAGVDPAGAMTLRTAHVSDAPLEEERVDDRVCDCCQTGAAVTANGPIVVYRDRSGAEIRDISIVRREQGKWTTPAPVANDGWEVPGCPVNGPSVAVGPDGRRVAVAWFTAAGNEPRVKVAFSDDAGVSFRPPIVVDEGSPLGRAAVTVDSSGHAVVVWLGTGSDESAPIFVRRVSGDPADASPLGARVRLSSTSASRSSGFPRIARTEGGVVVAWTEPGEPGARRARWLPDAVLSEDEPQKGDDTEARGPRPWDGRPGSMAPAYEMSGADGGQVTLAAWRGHPVLLNIWATWCAPCRREIPVLIRLHEMHAAAGLRVVGVSVDEASSRERVIEMAAREKIAYPILLDPQDKASSLFGLSMLPATFLFDSQGVLVWRRDGVLFAGDAELDRHLAQVLDPGRSPAR
jgi:thiol-disulfide isomerase/thioredoxin